MKSIFVARRRLIVGCLGSFLCIVIVGNMKPRPARSILEAELAHGGTVSDAVATTDTAVVLLYPPDYFLACAARFGEWRTFEKSGRLTLVVLLDRRPDEAERTSLALVRAQPDGRIRGMTGPREYLIVNGAVAAEASGKQHTGKYSPIFAAMNAASADWHPTTLNQSQPLHAQ